MKTQTTSRISIMTFCLLMLLPTGIHAQGTWSTVSSDGFTPRWAASAGEVDGKIYVMGGLGPVSAILNTLEVFEPASNSWYEISGTGTFTARHSASAVTVGGKIYVMGGITKLGGTEIVNTHEVFDPSSNSWSTPVTSGTFTARASFTSAVINGKIYVIGGSDQVALINTVEVFDPATNTWSTPAVTGTYTPRSGLASCVVNGKIYTFGGVNETSVLNTLEIFDPLTNVWSTPSTTGSFTARRGLTASFLGGKIYVIGGYDGLPGVPGNRLNTVEVFDPETNVWTTPISAGTFTARYGHTSTVVGGKIYALGGQTANAVYTNINEVFTPEGSAVKWNGANEKFVLSPNPTNGIVSVHGASENVLSVIIVNVLGETVMELKNVYTPELTLDLSKLVRGTYYIKFISANSVQTKMVVRE